MGVNQNRNEATLRPGLERLTSKDKAGADKDVEKKIVAISSPHTIKKKLLHAAYVPKCQINYNKLEDYRLLTEAI